MKISDLLWAGLVVAGAALIPHSATAVTVNCAAGQTVAGALMAVDNADDDDDDDLSGTITVKGTCIEDVTIAADGVTLRGHNSLGGRIEGSITIDGARRVTIENLEVADSATVGIRVTSGAAATITGSAISDSADENLLVIQSSNAILNDTEISGGFNGIVVARNSAVWLRGGNSVSGPVEEAVFVQQSSSFRAGIGDARDSFAATFGMAVKEVSSLDIRNADITCGATNCTAVAVTGGGTFRTRSNVKITGDVFVGAGSGVRLQDTDFVFGELVCNPGSYGFGGVGCP